MSIDYEKNDQIAIVTINRPDKMNCLNQDHLKELGRVWLDFRDDDQVRVALLTGHGEKAFCAGADLGELIPKVTSGKHKLLPTSPGFLKGVECYKPIIAAINGICVGGGTEILQATDIRISVEHAIFGLPEVKLALFPAAGSTVRLRRQIPYCWAMEMLLTGDHIDAKKALEIGLINRVVPKEDLMETALSIARRICRNGPVAVSAIKESVLKTYDLPEQHAYYLEAYLAGRVFGTRDAVEGPKAFIEKRKPKFVGK